MTDASRRDVLEGLAAAAAAAGVPLSDLGGDDGGGAELPDVPDDDAIWLALAVSVDAGEPEDAVVSTTEPIARLYGCSDADLSGDDVREFVRSAARGEYSERQEKYIRRRAADALDYPDGD